MLNRVRQDLPRLPQFCGSSTWEEVVAHDGVDVNDDAHKHHHVTHAWNRAYKSSDDEPQLFDGGYESQGPQ